MLVPLSWLKKYVKIDLSVEGIRPPHDHERHGGGGL